MRNLIFYGSYYEAIKELPDEEQGKVYKAIIDYGMTKSEPDLSGISRAIFVLIKPTLDASIKNYENGKKGGRPPKETQQETQTITQTETQEITQSESETQSYIIFEKENEKEKEKDYENDLLEKENTLTSVKESGANSTTPTKVQKHKYGKYKNVLLTEVEYNRLISEPDGEEAIEYYSENREIKGYKSKNDNLAIRKWAFDAVKEQRIKNARLNGTLPQQGVKKESPIEQLGRVLGGE